MEEIKERIKSAQDDIETLKRTLNVEKLKEEASSLEGESLVPGFWDDPNKARKVMQELAEIKNEVEKMESLENDVEVISELSGDEGMKEELFRELKRIESAISKLTLATYLSGPYDKKNAIVSIHAGQGGTEAMDWSSMLLRMYLRFCEKRQWPTRVVDMTPGEEAGVKSVTFIVEGSYAYGYLKREGGTHRLVRQSPFNADKLRQTSFALVEILPELEDVDLPDIKIRDEDIELQFFRASSQGGQNVQKVSTAVRIIHKPTGIVVSAQSERFQEQNRNNAMSLLRAKLWALEQEKQKSEKESIKGEYRPASWGTQIRSYVLHPYKMVKDLRTEVETGNTEAVLDGEIERFIEAELKRV